MDTSFGGIYSIRNNMLVGHSNPMQQGQPAVQNVSYNEAEKIANSLMALASYTMATVAPPVKQQATNGSEVENEIINEALRLQKHPKLLTFEELQEKAKFAITVNNSGRLMVDGSLYDGVIKISSEDENRYVEYKLGNPITVVSEYSDEAASKGDKIALKLTKYEYCKMTPYVTKTEKSLIQEKNWDNPTSDVYLAVPIQIQNHAGITKENNLIKS